MKKTPSSPKIAILSQYAAQFFKNQAIIEKGYNLALKIFYYLDYRSLARSMLVNQIFLSFSKRVIDSDPNYYFKKLIIQEDSLYIMDNFLTKLVLEQKIIVLHLAAQFGRVDIIEHLKIKYDLNPARKNNLSYNTLHFAAIGGQNEMIDYLIEHHQLSFSETTIEGLTALHLAARYGHHHTIEFLVNRHGFDPYQKDAKSHSLLTVAAMANQKNTVDYLMTHYDFKLNEEIQPKRKLIFYLVASNNTDMLDFLLSHYSIDLNEEIKHLKVENKIVDLLKATQIFFDCIERQDFNATSICLSSMSQDDKQRILSYLDKGESPFHFCIKMDNVDLATLLLLHGFSINELEMAFELNKEKVKPAQSCLTHAIVRIQRLGKFTEQTNQILNLDIELLNCLLISSQRNGPYQYLDQQIVAESLQQFTLYSEGLSLDEVKIKPAFKTLTSEEELKTRWLTVFLLQNNISYFPDNINLISRMMEVITELGQGFAGIFIHATNFFSVAVLAVESLKHENTILKAKIEKLESQNINDEPTSPLLLRANTFLENETNSDNMTPNNSLNTDHLHNISHLK